MCGRKAKDIVFGASHCVVLQKTAQDFRLASKQPPDQHDRDERDRGDRDGDDEGAFGGTKRQQKRQRADAHHHRHADAVEDVLEHDRRDRIQRRQILPAENGFSAFARDRSQRREVPDRIPDHERYERISKREALEALDAQRPRLRSHRHPDARQQQHDAKTGADLSNLAKHDGEAGGVERVGEEEAAGKGPGDGDDARFLHERFGVLNIESRRVKVGRCARACAG